MISIRLFLPCVALLATPVAVMAHHSPFLYFDPTTTIEIEGTITNVRWRNPHAAFMLEATDASGQTTDWILETHSVSILRRMDLERDVIKVGDKVKVAGWPAQRSGNEMFVTNMLLPQGTEIAFDPGSPPRWANETKGDRSTWMVTEEDITAGDGADGIFHVWSTSLVGGDANLLFDGYDFPLTEKAAESRAAFDMYQHPIIGTCEYKGMPNIMEQPYPMQFAKTHNRILMHMEEGNIVRVFDMTPDVPSEGKPSTALGHSVGKWQDGILVVTTTGSDWPYIDITGVPNSPNAIYVERFTPSTDGKSLDYTMTITAPGIFTTPATFSKQWLWVANAEVAPYDCVPQNSESS